MAAAVAISSTVKYGIIGVGMMGREHLINLHHLRTEGVAVFAIADPHVPSQDLALQLAQSFNWPLKVFSGHRELLDSGLCDVLVVSTPNMTHYEILMDIINHPKPHQVLVEKPLCTTVAHCKEVVVVNDKEEEETVEASNMVEPIDLNSVEITDNIVFRKLLRGPRYFDPPDSGWGACFNCGEEGHTVANCTAAKRKKPCFVCGSLEHNAKQCSKVKEIVFVNVAATIILSELAPELKLPSNYEVLLRKVFDDCTKRVWLHKKTGGVCLSIASKGLAITGIGD
ncbi:uncharacterized protein LOC126697265 isoform X1 [Quercus robur]|uniref:uncharacterized protein LOC126697265 isoform X1 n=1 Tax=Quercus robur TaxID=38942 RepID=UPI002161A5E3|nr:uncharacterized protein LOC126697265 isoform X1 [Quercus robur]XP_050250134.1 uncharacterized protein LOC126697265 isoform X1 [Quercus robur]XP_050250135.1 uncharacterized protein LOC126697265 isoform X1 [Quercus robur]